MKVNSNGRGAIWIVVVFVVMFGLIMPARSGITNYVWSATGSSLADGGGNWNATGGNNWYNSSNGLYGAWGNTANDQAWIGTNNGAAGTITVGAVTNNMITFAVPGSGSYTLSGGTITLAGSNPGISVLAGVTATVNSVISGTSGFIKYNTGVLYVTASNHTYSGFTRLGYSGNGPLVLSGKNARLGDGTLQMTSSGGTLCSIGALNGVRTITNTFLWGGGTTQFGDSLNNDRIVLTSDYVCSAGATLGTGNGQVVLVINGVVSGNNGATAWCVGRPGGMLILNGSNTVTGLVNVYGNEGANVVVVGHPSALGSSNIVMGATLEFGPGITTDFSSRFDSSSISYDFNTGGNNVTFSTAMTPSTASRPFYKSGVGTLTLNSATTNSFTGGVNLYGGVLLLDFANLATPANLLATNQQLIVSGGGLTVKGKSVGSTAQTFSQLNFVTDGQGSLVLNNNGGSGVSIELSTINRNAGSTLDVDLSAGGLVHNTGFTASSTYPYMTVKDGVAIGFARSDASKNLIRLTGQSVLTPSGNLNNVDYITSGNLSLNAGTKNFGSLTLDATSSSGTLNIGTGAFYYSTGVGGMALIGDNNYTITNGAVGAVGETLVHTLGAGTLTLESDSPFNNSGANTFVVKNGPGTLLIKGANTFPGRFVIGEGTVAIANSTALGSGAGAVTVAGDAVLRADAAGLAVANPVTFSGAYARDQKRILTVQANVGSSMTFSGAVTGHGGFIKTGAGTVTLSNTGNSYTGGTILSNGTVSISASANLGHHCFNQTVFAGGTLQITGTTLNNLDTNYINWDTFNGGLDIAAAGNTFTVNSPIGGPGSLTKSGAGTLVLAGANTFTGATAVSNGTFQVTGSLSSTNLSIGAGAVMAVASSLDLTGKMLSIAATAPAAGLLSVTGNLTEGGQLIVVNATTDQKIATWTGSVSGSFSSPTLPAGFVLKVVNGNELWVMKQRGTVVIMQ